MPWPKGKPRQKGGAVKRPVPIDAGLYDDVVRDALLKGVSIRAYIEDALRRRCYGDPAHYEHISDEDTTP
jgi:hypothetical protein